MSLPISVLIPLTERRRTIFEEICLPSIQKNDYGEILIDDSDEVAPVKRNRLAERARYDFLFFCDDDIVLVPYCLSRLYGALTKSTRTHYGYCYCDFLIVNHPTRRMDIQISGAFDPRRLLIGNYISMMSLIRREVFPGFDENLPKFQDWALWLELLSRGIEGYYLPERLFAALYWDEGITSRTRDEFAHWRSVLLERYGSCIPSTS